MSGFQGHEDATILSIPLGKALVQTVDFLAPLGNDPFTFGQIAAANALSDVYAMGGEPWCAMNIACFPACALQQNEGDADPEQLSLKHLRAILAGGLSKIHESGAVLAGGHTVDDANLKYGLSVSGIIDPNCIASNKGLRPGDALLLTKPLGTGILATGVKALWQGHEEAEKEFCKWATLLNRDASRLISYLGLKAATDITGFGLGGHALEMAQASNVCIELWTKQVPLMERVRDYAEDGLVPSGSINNRNFCMKKTSVSPLADSLLCTIAFDAQTSGGLLVAVPQEKLTLAADFYNAAQVPFWHVGQVLAFKDPSKTFLNLI